MKYIKNLIILFVIALILSSCASTEVRAVRQGDLQKLEKFLSKGGDSNEVDKDGNGLIHVAVEYGQPESLLALLNAGADADLLNRAGNTALIMAVAKNAMNMVDILLSYGANASIPGSGGRTTLMASAVTGSVPMMKRILSQGVDIEAVDNSGMSALFFSVSSNSPEALLYLLNSSADPGLTDNKDRTVLHLLTKNGQRPLARILIEAGADPSQVQSLTGELPLHIASGAGSWELVAEYLNYDTALKQINLSSIQLGAPLFYALNSGLPSQAAVNTMKILLDAGANPNIASVQNVLPIVHAVEKLDAPRVELLINWGALNNRLSEEKLLLHTAASRKLPKLVSVLLKAEIDPDLRDRQGNTALFIAVREADVETAELLLVSGAEPDIINNDGETVLYITLERDGRQKNGISEETSLLLRYRASLPTGKKILLELLLPTMDSGNAEVAEILFRAGANPNERVKDGMTLLMLSSSRRFVKLSRVLIIKSARINMWDKNGNTSMHFATGAGSVEGVELLLRYGEHPDRLNNEDIRPIQLAPKNDQGLRIIEILLAAGAKPLPIETSTEIADSADETPVSDDVETVSTDNGDDNSVVEESVSETVDKEKTTEEDTVAEDPVVEESSEEVTDIQGEDIKDDQQKNEEWGKAKVLYLGEDEPRKISEDRIKFEDFSALVPKFYPRNMYSQSNKREVLIYIRNETKIDAEIYLIGTDGKIEAVELLPSGGFIRMETREGNIYPVYTKDSIYFGEIKTTGQEVQYFRLAEKE